VLVIAMLGVALVTVHLSCMKVNTKPILTGQDYMVFAWNDLGMHCLNPTYDSAVILPPYNTIWVEVVKRGDPPQLITEGIVAEYKLKNNSSSYKKREYGKFWDNAPKLFGATLALDTGLNLKTPDRHNALVGEMSVFGDHFEAVGVPIVPVYDNGEWNPYQVAVITIKDRDGTILAQTEVTTPTSDEINCSKCHGKSPFEDIIARHDAANETDLADMKPFLCANCHGSPALGQTGQGEAGLYLSQAIHGFHSDKGAECYDCHPGRQTLCSRSLAHTAEDGNCTTCHGEMQKVAASIRDSKRVPWENEPKCNSCHDDIGEIDTGQVLYRNARGHGGLTCPACHGSPHAMIPSRQDQDNHQALKYQGKAVPIGSCRVCHQTSNGGGADFNREHTGANPKEESACNVCHTTTHDEKPQWPHRFKL
jgi:hypothetical protein